MQPQPPFITQAPRDLAGWVRLFEVSQLPVLDSSAKAIEVMRANEDAVDAHLLAEAINDDPLMTVKVLSHVAQLRRGRNRDGLGSDTENVTESLVMLGITPFFNAFGPQDSVQDVLQSHPDALQGFMTVLKRSRRAARFALGFAVHRMDHDANVIHEAALLRDFAELLLWLRAPTLALELARRLAADSNLRSVTAQRALLNVALDELAHALMVAWRLPALVVQITDEHAKTVTSSMRNVHLAIRVARHSAQGWDNAALPDDYQEIGQLLNLLPENAQHLLLDIDSD